MSRSRQRPRFDNSKPVAERLRKWVEDKPLALVIIATQVAFSVDDCYDLINMCRSRNGLFARLREVRLEERLPFYDSTWNVVRSLFDGFDLSSEDIDESMSWLKKLFSDSEVDRADIRREIASMPAEDLCRIVSDVRGHGKSLVDGQISDLLEDEPLDAISVAEIANAVQKSAIHFLLSVLVPCWVLTGQLPDR